MGEEALEHDKTGNLRRAPTPFPKEMRAMAKKVQSMREKKAAEDNRNSERKNNLENIEGGAQGIKTEMQKSLRKIIMTSTNRKRFHQVILQNDKM